MDGEAYFDVVRNPDKPFLIHTKKMDIKVLGTSFNVLSYSDEKLAEAALIKGSIEVTSEGQERSKDNFKTNEKISIANEEYYFPKLGRSNPVRIPKFEVNDLKPNPTYNIIGEIAWTQNKLFFEDETFENIGTEDGKMVW